MAALAVCRRPIEPAEYFPALLDIDMPRRDGWSTLKELRARGHTQPIVMLTQMNDVQSVVRGLEAGADGYMGKPYNPVELLARVRALLRRATPAKGSRRLRAGGTEVDLESRAARKDGGALKLTRTEFQLLELLHENLGKPVTRDVIVMRIWSGRKGSSQALDTLVWRLRRKLGDTSNESRWIQNLPGIGYVMPTNLPAAE